MRYTKRMSTTIFEKIINREIPSHIVYEDENAIAILDINPRVKGHTLVIPKAVSRTLLEMNPQTLGQYFAVVQKVAQAVKDSLNADGLSIILNTESAGGQEVFHTHTHIIPRFTNDEVSLNTGPHQAYQDDELTRYAELIKSHLS